jgi:superfamily II helicase
MCIIWHPREVKIENHIIIFKTSSNKNKLCHRFVHFVFKYRCKQARCVRVCD